jgi:uncharacterized spore protein YtfJ
MDESTVASIEPIEEMLGRLNVKAVFGEPIQQGEAVVVPVAKVSYGFGYGSGYGHGPARSPAAEQATTACASEGGGGGGGGGGMATPLGVLRITAEGVKYEPILDLTRISLAALTMVAWSVCWIARALQAFARK